MVTIPRTVVRSRSGILERAARQPWLGLCWLLLRVLPARRHAVVTGWPDDEGNSVEMVRALRRRYRGKVYWLLGDPAYTGPSYAAPELAGDARLVRVRKSSVRSVLLALTAETTFFTHGLFTAVPPPRSRLVVNVWHGDGPKITGDTFRIRSTVVVAGTTLWGGMRTQTFGVPSDGVAVLGNPRVDQFAAEPPARVLGALGLDPDRKVVLWLPTYRGAAVNGRSWRDGDDLAESTQAHRVLEALSGAAEEAGVQLVVKPHPLDSGAYDSFPVTVLRHEELRGAGVTLYQLLGAADGVISDVSSVWVDFLLLDRPVGLSVPDLAELHRRRGLNVNDLVSLFPGPIIDTPEEARAFVTQVATDPTAIRPSGYPGFARIGVTQGPGSVSHRLLDWLDDFQHARGRDRLFGHFSEPGR